MLLSVTIGKAQTDEFVPGDLVVNAGLGIGTSLYSGGGFNTTLPPISISADYGIEQDFLDDGTIGVGGYFGIASAQYRTPLFFGGSEYGWNYTYTIIGVRGIYSYPIVDKLDSYVGAMVAYNHVSVKEVGDIPVGFSASSGGVRGSVFVGGRYYFSDVVSGMLELGYGISYLRLGIGIRI